jgi:hypothetical protein
VGGRRSIAGIVLGLVACGTPKAQPQHVPVAAPTMPPKRVEAERPFWSRYPFQLPRLRNPLSGEERAQRRAALEALNGRRFAASNAIVKKLLETHPNNIALHVLSRAGSPLQDRSPAFNPSELDVWDQAFDALDEARFEEAFDRLERMARNRAPHAFFGAFHEVMASQSGELTLPREPSRARRAGVMPPPRPAASPARLKETSKMMAVQADSEWLAANGFEWPSSKFQIATHVLRQPRMVGPATDFKFGPIAGRIRDLTVSLRQWLDNRLVANETIILDDLWPSPGPRTFAWLDVRDDKLFVLVHAEPPAHEHGTVLKLDGATKVVDWETKAGACDSLNFVVDEALVWCGRALDVRSGAIVQLDRATGKAIASTRVAGTPRILMTRDGRLFVRTTSDDYIFEKSSPSASAIDRAAAAGTRAARSRAGAVEEGGPRSGLSMSDGQG